MLPAGALPAAASRLPGRLPACPVHIQARLHKLRMSGRRAEVAAQLTEAERRLQLDGEETAEWEAT